MDAAGFWLMALVGFALSLGVNARAEDPERHAASVVRQAREFERVEKEDEARALVAAVTKEYEAGVAAHPREALLWFGLARLQDQAKNNDGATTSLASALRLAPDNARLRSFHGWRLTQAEKVVEAEAEFKRAIELAPKDADIRLEYAVCLCSMKRIPDAEAQAREGVRLAPRDADAVAVWSLLLFNLDKQAEAVGTLQAAVELHPQNLYLRDGLATVLGASHRPVEAYAQCLEIRKLTPDSIDNESKLVVFASQMRDSKRAESHIARLRELQHAQKKETETFARDDFFVGQRRVVVEEYFEAKGDVGYKFVFHVEDQRGQSDYEVFLLTIDKFNEHLRREGKLKPEQRAFVLGKWQKNEQIRYGLYPDLPTYEQSRALAIEIIEGKRAPWVTKAKEVPPTATRPMSGDESPKSR